MPLPAAAPSLVTIPALASSLPQFSTLVSVLKAADLVDALSQGSLTVFAPTNDAFSKLPPALLTFLTAPENKQTLAKVLKYHVLGQQVLSKDIKPGTVDTLDTGSKLTLATSPAVTVEDGGINTAKVTQADVMASNGVVHVIDAVMVPKALVETVAKMIAPAASRKVVWDYALPKGSWDKSTSTVSELRMVHCPIGSTVEFKWTAAGAHHDLWQLFDESRYVDCNFGSPAIKRVASGAAGSYVFECSAAGEHFFACSVDNACSKGFQRVRIHVTEPDKTATLRARGDVSLAQVIEQDLVDFSYKGKQIESEAYATELMTKLASVAANAPESCSDWVPAQFLSKEQCLALVYTDMGVIMRSRPIPDDERAAYHYGEALKQKPGWCGAESYLTELKLKQGDAAAAAAQYSKACTACNPSKIDMVELDISFKKAGVALPDGGCSKSALAVPTPQPSMAPRPSVATTTNEVSAAVSSVDGEVLVLLVAGLGAAAASSW